VNSAVVSHYVSEINLIEATQLGYLAISVTKSNIPSEIQYVHLFLALNASVVAVDTVGASQPIIFSALPVPL
jgi:hypothetical protein